MEEENTITYAYETNPSSEQLLKIRREELKELRKKANKDRIVRLADNAQKRVIRDDKLDRINLKLKTIKERMVYYNRAGKKEKDGIDILGDISNLIENDVELAEDIARTKPIEDPEIKDLENELYVPEEKEEN